MTNNNVECPVDFVSVNERKARLTAAIVFMLTVIYLFTSFWPIPFFLIVDFFVRGFNLGRYSLLGLISDQLIRIFKIRPKPTDQAPKRFAAKIGLLFSIAIVALFAVGLNTASLVLASILGLFALLESALGICAGCHFYTLYTKILKKKTALLAVFFILSAVHVFQTTLAQSSKTETTFTIENYYKTKWGFADEFINLWKANHYPLLKKAMEKGDIISITAEKPMLHSGEDTRWDFKVTIIFKNIEKAFDANLTVPYKKLIYPDIDKLNKDEQHRFELLLSHWDVAIEKIAIEQ